MKKQIAKALVGGESQTAIARTLGVSQSTISRLANREDIKPFIEQEQMKLVEVVPDALENIKELVREMKDIPKDKTKRRELSYKASHDVLKAVGLMPTPMQSPLIMNIYNDNRNLTLSPFMRELLDRHDKELTGSTVGILPSGRGDNAPFVLDDVEFGLE